MTKYKISPNVSITPIAEYVAENIPEHFLKDHYVLYHEIKNRDYVINPTIKFFLDKFVTPHPISEVISEIKKALQTSTNDVETVCMGFFEFLLSKKIIVPEDAAKEVVTNKEFLFAAGDEINGFVIEQQLANRKEIELYKVNEIKSGSAFVLKILNRKKISDEQAFINEAGWLEREFEFLKRMGHIPETCKAYSFEKNENLATIQMEYIVGKSFNSLLNSVSDMALQGALSLIKKLLTPFASLHQHHLIHGDIHSANILINENNEVRIIDFGFSSVHEIEKDELLKSGGVTYYMPPERINNTSIKKYKRKSADLQSDVYQLGVLMYLAVYNKLPFSGFIWEELAENIQTGNVGFAVSSYSHYTVPEMLITIIKKCLQTNPEKRYENAGALLADFNFHFNKKPTLVVS